MKNLDWLSEKNTIKKLWIGFIFVLTITLVFQFFFPLDGHFKIEKFFYSLPKFVVDKTSSLGSWSNSGSIVENKQSEI